MFMRFLKQREGCSSREAASSSIRSPEKARSEKKHEHALTKMKKKCEILYEKSGST